MFFNVQDPVLSSKYRRLILSALLYQIILASFCSLLLDGGVTARVCAVAIIGYWSAAAMIMIRRRYNPSKTDLLLVRIGIVPFFLYSGIAARYLHY